jgi:hypothetical protein
MIENFGKFSVYDINENPDTDKQNLEVHTGPLTNPVFRHLRL